MAHFNDLIVSTSDYRLILYMEPALRLLPICFNIFQVQLTQLIIVEKLVKEQGRLGSQSVCSQA